MAFTELADGTESKQKASYVSHNFETKKTKNDYLVLEYKRLDGATPGVAAKATAFVATLDTATKDLIKAGGEFVVVKTKSGKFWNLTRVEDMSTYVEKPKSTYGTAFGTNTGYNKAGASSAYNTAGIKTGAVLHDACALAGVGATTAKVKSIAEELLILSYELEANINAGKYEPTVSKTAASVAPKAAELVVQEDSLDNIDF